MQILAFCMVQWLCGQLPWEDKLQDPQYVRDSKIRWDRRLQEESKLHNVMGENDPSVFLHRSQENIPEFLSQCFPPQDKPGIHNKHAGLTLNAFTVV